MSVPFGLGSYQSLVCDANVSNTRSGCMFKLHVVAFLGVIFGGCNVLKAKVFTCLFFFRGGAIGLYW